MKDTTRQHAGLTRLAKRLLGDDAVARVGVGPFWEDREPQQKFVVVVASSGAEVTIEVVSDHLRSRAKQRRIVDAVRAAIEAAVTYKAADWSAWHEDSWTGLALGDRVATLTRAERHARLSVAYGGIDVRARFWLRNAESAAAGMFARLVPESAVARMRAAHERDLAKAKAKQEEHERRMASDPAYAAAWHERTKAHADVIRGLFERDVQ